MIWPLGRRALVGLAVVVLAGCGGTTVSSAASAKPAVSGSAGAEVPTPASSSPATPGTTAAAAISPPPPLALLVDTDVAGDDLVALTLLVASPNVDLVGITVAGTGEAHCLGGV
jgi:hypothetical protein